MNGTRQADIALTPLQKYLLVRLSQGWTIWGRRDAESGGRLLSLGFEYGDIVQPVAPEDIGLLECLGYVHNDERASRRQVSSRYSIQDRGRAAVGAVQAIQAQKADIRPVSRSGIEIIARELEQTSSHFLACLFRRCQISSVVYLSRVSPARHALLVLYPGGLAPFVDCGIQRSWWWDEALELAASRAGYEFDWIQAGLLGATFELERSRSHRSTF